MKIKPRNPVFPIILGVVFSIFLIPTIYTLILSTKDYRYALGVLGSPSVGFKNFEIFIRSQDFTHIFGNTFVISLISLIVGAVYTFFASMSIGGIKNRWIKSCVGVLFAVTAFIPVVFSRFFIPERCLTPGEGYRTVVGIMEGLKLAGLVSFTAIFTKEDVLKQGIKTTLLFVVIRIVTFFTPDFSISLSYDIGSLYPDSDVFSSYIYRGLRTGYIGITVAIEAVRMFLQLLLAIPMILVTKYVMREEKTNKLHQPLFGLFSVSGVIPIIIFMASIILCSSLLPANAPLATSYLISFITALFSTILVGFISYGITLLARNSGILGVIFIILLCSLSGNIISNCIICTQYLELGNSLLALILPNLRLVPLITMLFTFATKDNRSFKKDMAVLFAMMIAIFAMTWGDFFNTLLYVRDTDLYPIPYTIRKVAEGDLMFIYDESSLFSEYEYEFEPAPMSTAPFLLLPIIMAFGGSMLVALLNKTKAATSAPAEYVQQNFINQQYVEQSAQSVQQNSLSQNPVQKAVEDVQNSQQASASFEAPDLSAELRKYKTLLDEGLITEEDYNAKKAELLNR